MIMNHEHEIMNIMDQREFSYFNEIAKYGHILDGFGIILYSLFLMLFGSWKYFPAK